jgi:hypothetical protein
MTMALPEQIERLKQISIDTLNLSESTSALIKWFNFTSILDCIVYFSEAAHYTYFEVIDPWPRLYLLLFGEVKPKLIAAGYWDLVMDTEMGRLLDEYRYYISHQKREQRIVRWQGREQNLYDIPFEPLGLSHPPNEVHRRFASIGACIDYFFYQLGENPKYWLDIGTYKASDETAGEPLALDAYMLRVAQPRLVELGYWRFVEDYIDDVIEEGRFWGDFDWEDEESDDEDDDE